MLPLVYADFQNTDTAGRIRLNTSGTGEDLVRHRLVLAEGLRLTLYTDDADAADGLRLDGTVTHGSEEDVWVAVVDWATLHRTEATPLRPAAFNKAI